MIEPKRCQKCGKLMREQPKWRGLWTCPDFDTPINDAPPYEYRCTGVQITQEGAEAFENEFRRIVGQSN